VNCTEQRSVTAEWNCLRPDAEPICRSSPSSLNCYDKGPNGRPGNPVFADVVSSIAAGLSGQSEMLNARPHRRAESQTEHRTIAAAVARGSAVEAEDAVRFHLEQVREALSLSLTEPQRKSPPQRAARSRRPAPT